MLSTSMTPSSADPRRQPCTYRICGATIRSNTFLPADAVTAGAVDIDVNYEPETIRRVKARPSFTPMLVVPTADGALIEYRNAAGDVCRFVLSNHGTRIEVSGTSAASVPGLWCILLGLPLGASLFLRGKTVLHASAAVVDRRAIMVAGPSGAGKSATVAALLAVGAALLADDICALSTVSGRILAEPGYPVLRMYPDTGSLLGRSATELPRVFDLTYEDDKRWVDARDLRGGFHSTPAPLSAIYLLTGRRNHGPLPIIEPIQPAAACLALGSHGFAWHRFDPSSRVTLAWRAHVAAHVPAFDLTMPAGLDRMPAAAEAIMRHSGTARWS